jgi:colicin import membrane protein
MKRPHIPASVTAPLMHPATGTDYRAPLYVDSRGRAHYPIGGAADETDEERQAREAAEAEAANNPTITQAEMGRIAAREKREGRNSGQLELAKELGFETVDAMKAAAQRQKDAEDAAKTEAQRAIDDAKAEKDASARERAEAAAERRTARMERALIRLGVGDDDLDDAIAMREMRELPADADADAIADAAQKLKDRRAGLFGGKAADDENEERPPAARLPGGKPGKRKEPAKAEVGAAGLARARRKGWNVPE